MSFRRLQPRERARLRGAAALGAGELDPARWRNYLKLRDELGSAAESLEIQLRRKGEPRGLAKAPGRRVGEKFGER